MAFFGHFSPKFAAFPRKFKGLTFTGEIVNNWRRSESDFSSSSERSCQFWFLTKNNPVILNFNEKASWI
jgi:hypothetical protein